VGILDEYLEIRGESRVRQFSRKKAFWSGDIREGPFSPVPIEARRRRLAGTIEARAEVLGLISLGAIRRICGRQAACTSHR
jgi:hypothetical protein